MPLLSLDDPRWASLSGGYRLPYDASPVLKRLADGENSDSVWEELWEQLHHQGDVGEASYAAIPSLVDICISRDLVEWNLFSLASAIEVCRHDGANPPIPGWIATAYREAWDRMFMFGLQALPTAADPLVIRSILGVAALHKDLRQWGRLLSELDDIEVAELYDEFYGPPS